MSNILKHQLYTILFACVVMVLCFVKFFENRPEGYLLFNGSDKVVHFIMFQTLSFLTIQGFDSYCHYNLSVFRALGITICVAIFAAFTELMQSWVFTSHQAEWWDFVVDILGCGVAFGQFGFQKIIINR